MIDKQILFLALRQRVSDDLAALERRQRDIQEGATHAENRAEHAKDTRATEQSYLARGLAERVQDLGTTLSALAGLDLRRFDPDDAVAVGALVEISKEADGAIAESASSEFWFVVPFAGGIELAQEGTAIRTVTPVSPLGRALLGLCLGEEGSFRTPRGRRDFEILGVS